jgi:D-lactate dehydrogenase
MFEMTAVDCAAVTTLAAEHELTCTAAALDARNAAAHADAEIISTFLTSSLDSGILAKFPNLRMIAVRSTGYDNVDLEYCHAHKITVCNVPDYGDVTVAEHAFALLLALSKRLISCIDATRQGNFAFHPEPGFELRGKLLGVVGTGRIGRRAIEIACGFGMEVIAYDQFPRPDEAERLGFRYDSFREVIANADILTLHVPATPETVGLMDDNAFSLMKRGVILINTARGTIIDIAALVRALSSGKVGGAGLDVLPNEPLLREETRLFGKEAPTSESFRNIAADHALLHFSNVIITPHNAYNTTEALRRIINMSIKDIQAFTAGQPINCVS